MCKKDFNNVETFFLASTIIHVMQLRADNFGQSENGIMIKLNIMNKINLTFANYISSSFNIFGGKNSMYDKCISSLHIMNLN